MKLILNRRKRISLIVVLAAISICFLIVIKGKIYIKKEDSIVLREKDEYNSFLFWLKRTEEGGTTSINNLDSLSKLVLREISNLMDDSIYIKPIIYRYIQLKGNSGDHSFVRNAYRTPVIHVSDTNNTKAIVFEFWNIDTSNSIIRKAISEKAVFVEDYFLDSCNKVSATQINDSIILVVRHSLCRFKKTEWFDIEKIMNGSGITDYLYKQ